MYLKVEKSIGMLRVLSAMVKHFWIVDALKPSWFDDVRELNPNPHSLPYFTGKLKDFQGLLLYVEDSWTPAYAFEGCLFSVFFCV